MQPRAAVLPAPGARDVHLGQVHRRVPLDDPLGQRLPGARGIDDPLRVEPRRDEQPAHLGELAQVEVRVRREALRRPQVVLELERPQLGQPLAGLLEHGSEVVPVRPELDEPALVDRAGRARLPPRLEGADQVAAPVVPDVEVAVEVAQDRQRLLRPRRLFRHHPDVLGAWPRRAARRSRRPTLTLKRMDNVLIVVDDLEAAMAFFTELGMELEGQAPVEGRLLTAPSGSRAFDANIAMLRPRMATGGSSYEFHTPAAIRTEPHNAPANTLGIRRIMFAVDDIDTSSRACETTAPNSSAKSPSTRTCTGSVTFAAPRGSSSGWPSSSTNGPARPLSKPLFCHGAASDRALTKGKQTGPRPSRAKGYALGRLFSCTRAEAGSVMFCGYTSIIRKGDLERVPAHPTYSG